MRSNFAKVLAFGFQFMVFIYLIAVCDIILGGVESSFGTYLIYLLSYLFSDRIKPSQQSAENLLLVENRPILFERLSVIIFFLLVTKLINWLLNNKEYVLPTVGTAAYTTHNMGITPAMQDQLCLTVQRSTAKVAANFSPFWKYRDAELNSKGSSQEDYYKLRAVPLDSADRPKAVETLCRLAFKVIKNQYNRIDDDNSSNTKRMGDIIGLLRHLNEYLTEATTRNYKRWVKSEGDSQSTWINTEIEKLKNQVFHANNTTTVAVAEFAFNKADRVKMTFKKSYYEVAKFLFSSVQSKDANTGLYEPHDRKNYYKSLHHLSLIDLKLAALSSSNEEKNSLLASAEKILNRLKSLPSSSTQANELDSYTLIP